MTLPQLDYKPSSSPAGTRDEFEVSDAYVPGTPRRATRDRNGVTLTWNRLPC